MIKIFSVFSVLVFISSAVKSFAYEPELNVSKYEEVWTYDDEHGYQSVNLTSQIQCNFLRSSRSDSKLRILERVLNTRLGISSNIPLKEEASVNSKTVAYINSSSVVKLVTQAEGSFARIEVIQFFDRNQTGVKTGYVSTAFLKKLYAHDIRVEKIDEENSEQITLRSFKSEVAMCIVNNKMANRHPFESKDGRRLILVAENNFGLFEATTTTFAPVDRVRPTLPIDEGASPLERADANLVNSGPDLPITAWIPKQPANPSDHIGDTTIYQGASRDVICSINADGVDVLGDDKEPLTDLLKALTGETVLVSQDVEPRTIEDIEYIRVMFRDQNRVFGWVPKYSIKSRAECNSLNYPEAQYVETCTNETGEVRARDESLDNIVTKIPDGSKALVISEQPEPKTISGVEYKFVELQFEGEEGTLWVPNKFLTSGSCDQQKEERRIELEAQMLEASKGYVFPLYRHPLYTYIQDANYNIGRGFNGKRCKNGWEGPANARYCPKGRERTHAANDLMVPKVSGTKYKGPFYRSIGNGVVLRDVDAFYQGTYEIIVMDKKTGRIFRYGEVYSTYDEPSNGKTIKAGEEWSTNQKIGRIKAVSSSSTPMLHFELYSAGARDITLENPNGIDVQSDLSHPSWGKYYRHPNLIDPTEFIRGLERNTPDLTHSSGVTWL